MNGKIGGIVATRLIKMFPVVLLAAASPPIPSGPGVTSAWIQTGSDTGQGFFARAKSGCFLVTAAHVFLNDGYPSPSITFRRDGGIDHTAKVIWFPDSAVTYDVGYLDASSAADRPTECPNLLPTPDETDAALQGKRAEIIAVSDDGDRSRILVEIIATKPRIIVRPLAPSDQIKKGLSGAPLVISGRPFGVVSAVDNSKRVTDIIVERLDAAPRIARDRVDIPVEEPGGGLFRKYLPKLDENGRTAYEDCKNDNFEMCNIFGQALITFGLDNGDPWTQDAAAPFFAKACDHEVPWSCSNLALLFKQGTMSIKPARDLAKKYYDLDCTGHGDSTKAVAIACKWRDQLH